MAFLVIIICFLKLQLYLCIYLFLYLSNNFLSYNFSALNFLVQSFSLNFARTLGRSVDKLLHASRVNLHGQFIFGKQSSGLFRSRGNTAFQQSRRCNFSHFQDKVKTGLFFTFFRKSILLTMKIASQIYHLG